MIQSIDHARTIFLRALEGHAPEQWDVYLDIACGGDCELRAHVANLLHAHQELGSIRDVAPACPDANETPAGPQAGSVIGPYKLLEQIGEGGMGVVYMAEQTAPVKRMVALKVIKPGMDTRQIIVRFEAERQALALMDHPNIARILDAGTTETPLAPREGEGLEGPDGSGVKEFAVAGSARPYFVMELVRGVPITEYCDEHQLSTAERLEMFMSVCHAVQHAHQKGIIHRDLKPTNVLVTLHDDRPVVKIIDFGIAKALSGQLTEHTLFTGFALMIGSPLYMSPEQAAMSGLDVDTRSDVYSLGVLLYELLTGTTPFDKARLRQSGIDEIRRIIREEEPPRPSARASTLAHASTVRTIRRRDDRPQQGHSLRGDLDWIVMKCLEKDRNRRYESASALARDVERHLDDEPVCARPPSAWYRFSKFARRNRGGVLLSAACVLVVFLAVVALSVSNVLIRREQQRTRYERDRAGELQALAEENAAEVRLGLERLKAANDLLDRGQWYTSEQRWDDAHAAFSRAVELRPDHASVWHARGELRAYLGLWDLAAADFSREFEVREPSTSLEWYQLALLRLHLGEEEGYRRIRDGMRVRFRGTSNINFTSEVVRTVALDPEPPADPELMVDLARNVVTSQPRDWLRLYVLGAAEYRAGRHEQAIARLEESLESEPAWAGRAIGYPLLAMAHYRLGHVSEARAALRSAALTIEDWTTDMYLNRGLGHWISHQGATGHWPIAWWDWLECRHYFQEACVLIDGAPPRDDPRLTVMRARSFAGLRWHDEAQAEYAAALQLLGDDTQVRLESHRVRGYRCVRREEWREAAGEFTQASEFQLDDAYLWRFRAVTHLAAGDLDDYRRTCEAMLERFADGGDPSTAANVALVCVVRPDAVADWDRLLDVVRIAAPRYHTGVYVAGAALYRAGDAAGAVRHFESASRLFQPRAWDWAFLSMAHQRLGDTDEAERCLAEGRRWIEIANRRDADPTDAQPTWSGWHEKVIYPLLIAEAEQLISRNDGRFDASARETRQGAH